MSIYYDFYRPTGRFSDDESYYVRALTREVKTTAELSEIIQARTTATTSDVKVVLDALCATMSEELLRGNHVQIDGLGTFGASMRGDVVRDKLGRLQLRNARVHHVRFHPSNALMQRLVDARFARQPHGHRPAQEVSREMLIETAQRLGSDGAFFTTSEYASELRLTLSTARRRLKGLVAEGLLTQFGTRGRTFFRWA